MHRRIRRKSDRLKMTPLVHTTKAIKRKEREVMLVFDLEALKPNKNHDGYRVTSTIKRKHTMKKQRKISATGTNLNRFGLKSKLHF